MECRLHRTAVIAKRAAAVRARAHFLAVENCRTNPNLSVELWTKKDILRKAFFCSLISLPPELILAPSIADHAGSLATVAVFFPSSKVAAIRQQRLVAPALHVVQ